MKLYLRSQVEDLALAVWGSEEALEKAIEEKEARKEKAKQKAFDKKIKELRMRVMLNYLKPQYTYIYITTFLSPSLRFGAACTSGRWPPNPGRTSTSSARRATTRRRTSTTRLARLATSRRDTRRCDSFMHILLLSHSRFQL